MKNGERNLKKIPLKFFKSYFAEDIVCQQFSAYEKHKVTGG